MKRLAIISDTHSLLREEVKSILQSCDGILHAGDIAVQELVDAVCAIAPAYFVRGNADKAWAEEIPYEQDIELYGYHFYMVHNRRDIRKDLTGVDIVIFGHSHKYEETTKDGILYFNPGSCGPRRFHQPVTMAVMTIDEEQHAFSIEKKDLSPILTKDMNIPKKDMDVLLCNIMKDMDAGRTVAVIAKRNRVEEEFVNQILQIYTTHPGIDVYGIMNRMDILGK